MVTSTCPNTEDLRSFNLGMLDEGRELEVLDHLSSCQSCEDTVANLEGTADSLVVAVRGSVSSEASGSDSQSDDRPALQQALAEIENLVAPPAQAKSEDNASAVSVTERIRDYELLGSLGEGGMGTVYKARHTRLDREVALKLLPARRLRDNAAVARFEREMKAIGRLDHPTIVRATDAGDVDGTHFLAMDYVEGVDLSKLVRLVGPLDVASACEIVRQAAIGLDYAHQQELIHRDVKPSNLMLTLRGEVRILDLGLALFGAASEALDELTTVGQLMGTLDYMAPEQGDNSHDIDARADVYSLGATLFKLLTATAPYDSPGTRTPLAKMKALATIDAPSVANRRAELPAELVAIVDRALLRNVDDRFATAKDMADSLVPFCEGHVLQDLAECGRDLAAREDAKIPQPPFVQKPDAPAAETSMNQPAESVNRRSITGRKLHTWMLAPLVMLAGIVIWIETDNGTLVVESPKDNIPIEIRTGGEVHSEETLSLGKNELTIHSGTYEIVLPKEYESLTIENNVFTLKRGDEWIARVSKKSPTARDTSGDSGSAQANNSGSIAPSTNPGSPGAAPGMPPGVGLPGTPTIPQVNAFGGVPAKAKTGAALVFSGKTFEEWQRAVLTERNPEELEKAVQALCILGRHNRDAEAAAIVLRVVDAYPCEIRRGSSEAELVASSIRYLRTLDATSIVPEVAEATRNGGKNTRELILTFLAGGRESSTMANSRDLGTGNAQPLADKLKESETFYSALLDVFPKLEWQQRQFVFTVLSEALSSEPPDLRLIPFLKICVQKRESDDVSILAAQKLAELQPTAELADLFLKHLEGTDGRLQKLERGRVSFGHQVTNWWDLEANAWMGLAALGKHAEGAVDRIAQLVEKTPSELAETKRLYLTPHRSSEVEAQYEVHRQLLAIEILALIGPAAKTAIPTLNKALQDLTGHAPSVDGHFGFDGFRDELVLERAIGQNLSAPKRGRGLSIPNDIKNPPDRVQRLNSALVAVRRITGQSARFDVSNIHANGPYRRTGEIGSGYPGGVPGGGYPGGTMEEYSEEGEYDGASKIQYSPQLVTYKGKSFDEWTDLRNISLEIPLSDLRDIFRGATLLARTPEEQKAAAIIANGVFGHVIRQPTELTPEIKNFLVETIEASYSHDPTGVLTPIEDALAQVVPARQAILLNEFLVPVEETKFGFRLQPRSFSRAVVTSSQFPNAYNDLVENWDKHSMELQEAILDIETFLASEQKHSYRLLTRLVKEAYDAATSGDATKPAMTDLQLKAALILAATEPKNADVRQQLEKLLSDVLTKAHVLRVNRRLQGSESEFGGTPAHVEVKPPTTRDLDADRLHAAIGLKLSCGGSLSSDAAWQFAKLIIQDTERHEVGKFRIVSPPNWPAAGVSATGFDEYGAGGESMDGYAMSSGHPGMSGGGYPDMAGSATYEDVPTAASFGEEDYGGGKTPPFKSLIPFKGSLYNADHGEFSRRLMMIRLLLECPPADANAKNEIGEQLAATLLKSYPQGFLPAPPSGGNNVSVYDLIETEFRSGVRFRKLPTTSEKDVETARFIDTASGVVWNYLPDDRRKQLQQSRISELQAAQIAAQQPQQIYDGRPFEEWLVVVNTERSPERLAEAVAALTILGKNGRDAEAARAILKCLAPFSADSRGQKTPEGKLVNTINDRLWKLDAKATAAVIADLIESGNSSQRKFLLVHNSRHIKNRIEPGGLLAKPQFVNGLLEATKDNDSEVRWQASAFLIPMLLTDDVKLGPEILNQATERLKALLTDPRAKTPAAICLAQLAPDTPGLTDVLLAEIEQLVATNGNGPVYAKYSRDNHDSLQFPDAYWALRKLIVHNQSTPEGLITRLLKLLKIRRQGDPGRFFEVDYYRFDHRTLIAELLVAIAPRTQVDKTTIRDAFTKLANSAAQLPNRQATDGELAQNTTQPNLPVYTPVLTDSYPFPLPTELRYPQSSAWEEKDRYQRADEFRAAKWALEQLEKSSPSENADE